MSLTPLSADSPVIKIGAVVLRANGDFLILQPIPKNTGEFPPFVFARGSRQYQDENGVWHDARDMATGERHKDRLEPFTRGLEREAEEEAGVTPAMFTRAQVTELGARNFQSSSKGVYPIHWFVVQLAEADAATLTDKLPSDALSSRWAGMAEMEAMAARGEFSAGYLEVAAEALRSALPHRLDWQSTIKAGAESTAAARGL